MTDTKSKPTESARRHRNLDEDIPDKLPTDDAAGRVSGATPTLEGRTLGGEAPLEKMGEGGEGQQVLEMERKARRQKRSS